MNQNDIISGLLVAGVVGGLVVLRQKTLREAAATGPAAPPPGVIIPPGTPGSDVQLTTAQQTIASAIAALNAQGGGTQAQKEQMASALEAQATQIDLLGGSPAASAALRQAAAQLRGGQLPPPGPAPGPAPAPSPGSDPQIAAAQQLIASITAGLQTQGNGVTQPQLDAAATTLETQAALVQPSSPSVALLLQQAAAQLRSGQLPAQPVTAPRPPVAVARTQMPATGHLIARYHELRDHLMGHLQGARPIDHATLGAADRTAADLHAAGDAQRAADLGALSSASYQRAGIARPAGVAL